MAKIISIDTNILIAPFAKDEDVPPCVKTGEKIPYSPERTRHFLRDCEKNNIRILLPAPVIAEFLVCSTDCTEELRKLLTLSSTLTAVPFDQRAAYEHAEITREAIASKNGKTMGIPESWQKIKFDRQIVAISKALGAQEIYCADKKLAKHAELCGLSVKSFSDMDLPPEVLAPQFDFTEEGPDAGSF